MTVAEAEHRLRADLPIQSIAELQDFPCATYAEFLDANRAGRVEVLTRYDPETVDALGSGAEKFMHYALAWTPAFIALALVIFSFVLWNFWLLVGIPLALLGSDWRPPPLESNRVFHRLKGPRIHSAFEIRASSLSHGSSVPIREIRG